MQFYKNLSAANFLSKYGAILLIFCDKLNKNTKITTFQYLAKSQSNLAKAASNALPHTVAVGGDRDPRLIQCFLYNRESSQQTRSQFIQPFLHTKAKRSRVADRQTNRTSVAVVCISCVRCSLKSTKAYVKYHIA